MAISSYLRECGYDLGGLLPKVYLVHKNALKLSKKAKGLEVSVVSRNDGDIYCVEGQLCTYKQEETYNGKYRFNSTLELTINELYREPFLYGLRTLRTNEYYIIIEDKKGVQYLINPELYTKMSYEYSFSDTSGNNNHIIITYNNLSNYPLLIFEENISDNKSLLNKQCEYNYGQVYELLMFDHKDLKVKDDGVKVDEMYIENVDDICEIDFMKESFSLTESYDGKTFITSLAFNIPLNDQYGWAYRLLEFKDNKYAAILRTTNDNYIIVGVERGLFPSYTIETSEDDNVPNMVKVVFEQRSQYPILYTDEITQYRWVESEPLCFGFDRYQMLVKEKSEDWGETWVVVDPIVKKKGKIIETDSEACKEYQWVEDGEYCEVRTVLYEKWVGTEDFICEGGNKYVKTQKTISVDGINFYGVEEFGMGELMEEKSQECQYVAVRWVEQTDYMCYLVNEDYNRWIDQPKCVDTSLMNASYEEVSSNGIAYYESGEEQIGDVIIENCCQCGYREDEWREDGEVCGSEIYSKENPYVGDWIVEGNKFTSNPIDRTGYTVQRIYFYGATVLKFKIDQSSYDDYNYLLIGNIDTPVSTSDYSISWKNKTTGITSITVSDTNEHFIELMFYKWSANSSGRENVIVKISGIDATYKKFTQFRKYLVCDDGLTTAEEKTEDCTYELEELHSCDCGWTGYSYVSADEYICGSELGSYYDPKVLISEVSGDWTVKGLTFVSNPIGDSEKTVERVYFRLNIIDDDTGEEFDKDIKFFIQQRCDVMNGADGDYLIIGNIDQEVIDSKEGNLFCGYNVFEDTTVSVTIEDSKIHFVEFMYRKDEIRINGGDNVIVTMYSDALIPVEPTSEYEIWDEIVACDVNNKTGNVIYINPQPSYDCGLETYEWKMIYDDVCGIDLSEDVEIVDEIID